VSTDSTQGLNGHSRMSPRLRETDLPLLGSIQELREVVRQTSAECLFVSSAEVGVGGMAYVTELARLERLELRATSNFPEMLTHRLAVQPVGGVMALSLKPASLTGPQALAKRIFDVVVGSLALVVSIPLWLGIALAIRLTSRGPVLFRQERVGVRGRPFMLFKFRTMVENAEELLEDLRDRNEAPGPLFKLREDPRLTKVGGWLRRRSLDELPQLLNVLRGDMSLVGPRPCLPEEIIHYDARALERLDVPPGVTGLWQVQGRSNVSFDEYVRLDVFYVENWSLAYDLYILLKTVRAVLSRDGAY
jgi:exopolysaccharide biosynthesis polyprenyl glycosylphosphotransferase